jgi:hypothetical protein
VVVAVDEKNGVAKKHQGLSMLPLHKFRGAECFVDIAEGREMFQFTEPLGEISVSKVCLHVMTVVANSLERQIESRRLIKDGGIQ